MYSIMGVNTFSKIAGYKNQHIKISCASVCQE